MYHLINFMILLLFLSFFINVLTEKRIKRYDRISDDYSLLPDSYCKCDEKDFQITDQLNYKMINSVKIPAKVFKSVGILKI